MPDPITSPDSNGEARWVIRVHRFCGQVLGYRQGVIGSGTISFPISFNHVLSGFAQFDSTVKNDDMWNNDVAIFISNTSIRCGVEGNRFYHIGIGY